MNTSELAEALATQIGLSKKAAKEAVDALFETISKTMCDGEPVRITGFGTFKPIPSHGKARPRLIAHSDLRDQMSRKLKVVEASGKPTLVKAVR